jgi:hypothetical protein
MHAAGRPIAILLAESIDNNESDNQHVEKSKSTSQYLHWSVLVIIIIRSLLRIEFLDDLNPLSIKANHLSVFTLTVVVRIRGDNEPLRVCVFNAEMGRP